MTIQRKMIIIFRTIPLAHLSYGLILCSTRRVHWTHLKEGKKVNQSYLWRLLIIVFPYFLDHFSPGHICCVCLTCASHRIAAWLCGNRSARIQREPAPNIVWRTKTSTWAFWPDWPRPDWRHLLSHLFRHVAQLARGEPYAKLRSGGLSATLRHVS